MPFWFPPPPPIVSQTGAQPYAGNKLPPAITAAPVSNPPFAWQQIPTWGVRGGLPQTTKFIPQGVPVNNPPFTHMGRSGLTASIIQSWQPPDPPPTLPRELSPGIPGQSVDNPPPVSEGRYPNATPDVIVRSWQPPDPLPTLPGKLSPGIPGQSVDFPPFVNEWLDQAQGQIVLSWFPPDPPTQPQRYVPQVAPVVVTQGPYVNVWLATVLAAWQPPDPPPVQRGPLNPQITAVEVDNPPFAWKQIPTWGVRGGLPQTTKFLVQPGAAAVVQGAFTQSWLSSVLASWQPLETPYQQIQVKQVQPFVAASVQQAFTSVWLNPVLASWQLSDLQPTLPRNLNPSITAVPVNNPPFVLYGNDTWLVNVLGAWQPPDPPPTQKGPLNPALSAVSADNPPFVWQQIPTWGVRGTLPQTTQFLPQPFTSAVTTQVPFQLYSVNVILASWRPVDPPPTLPKQLNPQLTAVQVDNPPFGLLVTVIEPWLSEAPFQSVPYRLTVGVRADNPPFTQVDPLPSILASWQPPDPLPTVPRINLVQAFAPPVQVIYQPYWLNTVLTAWQPPDPQPQQPAYKVVTGVAVNNPPFTNQGRSAITVGVVQSWQPPDPPPVQRGPLNPQITAVPVNNPPGVNLDNTPTYWAIIGTWEIPLPPQPQQTKYIVTILPPPPPVKELHDHPFFATFGKMTVH